MSITADTESGAQASSAANSLNNKLLLADAGYISRSTADVTKTKGSYLVIRGQNLNPKVQAAYRQDGRKCPVTRAISIGEAAEPRFWIWM